MSEWEAWRAQVEKELKGASYDKALVTTLREGIRVEPVYAARDFDPKTDRASAAVRGAAAQDRAPGWHRAMRYVGSDPKAIGDAIREDLAGGMDAVFLPFDRNLRMRVDPTTPENRPFIGQDGAALYQPDDMDLALHGVRANLKVLALDSGARLPLSVARFSSVDRLLLGVDPLGALARDGAIPDTLEGSIGRVAEVVRGVWASSALSSMTASSEPWEAAGANAVEQLAWSIATGAHYVQALCALGIPAAQAAAQVTFRVAIGRDIFTEIARLRALRLLWNMVRASLDIAGDAPVFVHAIGAHSTLSARDPWVNMLRATNETFAAIAGGADMITTRAFDEALGGGGQIPRRVARNTQIILDEECHLGQVIDPAGGSYYVETLTRSIARAAWEELQSVEALGGIVPAILSGALQSRCLQSWRARRDALAKRREVVTGVSEFANVGEKRPVVEKSEEAAEGRMAEFHATPGWEVSPPMVKAPKLESHREAEVFEGLRDRADAFATRPVVYLATLGARAEFTGRAMWSQGFFAAGGFDVKEDPGCADGALDTWAARARTSGAAVVCVCGADAAYEATGEAALEALRAQGIARIWWAQKPGAREAALRAAGVQGFIHLGCDVAMTLSTLLEEVSP